MVTLNITPAKKDISKIVFQCTGELESCYSTIIPFGLKNVGATYQRYVNFDFL